DSHALRILNWEKCFVEENKFSDITNVEGSLKAILVSGANYPTITNNVFRATDRAIQIMPWKNINNGSSYPITYNQISATNIEAMLKNTLLTMGEYILRYNRTYEEFTLDTEKWEVFNPEINAFSVTPATQPFQNYFIGYSTYNSKTKQYYMLRSYLEQLEKVGGGTLTLAAGTYEITNSLFVSSHVTICFEDGVIIKKTEDTGTEAMVSATSIFQLAAPSKSKITGAYGGYEGETDIRFIGKGTAIIDMNYIEDAIGIMFGHNSEVSVSGITFQNMFSGHFIELDASRNITIENNFFRNHRASLSGIKEAINIDTPDKNTEGFNVIWTNYDCTANKDVVIKNNSFKDLERAIGTHKYSDEKYHENIQILDNKIENTTSDAIRIINWLNPVIKGNEIKSINGGNSADCAILASGVTHPIITENTFIEVGKPIQLKPWKNNGSGGNYAITYNVINNQDIALMQINYLVRVGEAFIRVNNTYKEFILNTDKYYYSYEYITR
ncbi:MAG: glycoside hydrolase family protein, partial [Mobilitalea sp.]